MLTITISITGNKEAQRMLQTFGRTLPNMRSAMTEIGKNLVVYYSNQAFSSQGGVFGAPWRPLNRQYALRKFRKYPGRPPLVASERMKRSFKSNAAAQSVTISNSAPYFVYHQSSAPRKVLPRRKMMGVNAPIRLMIGQTIKQDIHKKLRLANG